MPEAQTHEAIPLSKVDVRWRIAWLYADLTGVTRIEWAEHAELKLSRCKHQKRFGAPPHWSPPWAAGGNYSCPLSAGGSLSPAAACLRSAVSTASLQASPPVTRSIDSFLASSCPLETFAAAGQATDTVSECSGTCQAGCEFRLEHENCGSEKRTVRKQLEYQGR